jgi:hypothetical protein
MPKNPKNPRCKQQAEHLFELNFDYVSVAVSSYSLNNPESTAKLSILVRNEMFISLIRREKKSCDIKLHSLEFQHSCIRRTRLVHEGQSFLRINGFASALESRRILAMWNQGFGLVS